MSHTQSMTLNHRTMHELTLRVLPRLTCQESCDSHMLYYGTIFDATFHNNMIVVVAILTTLRPCQICRHICITILHHYKHRHILSCILLCSLEIATTLYHLSFNWYIAVVVTIMHKLTPWVVLWLTCTNILWEYVVTNIVVVVVDAVCIVVVVVIAFETNICYLTITSRRHYYSKAVVLFSKG